MNPYKTVPRFSVKSAGIKIGISLLWLLPGYTGLETYARGLLAGLAQVDFRNRYVLFTNPLNHMTFDSLPERFSRRLCGLPLRSRVAWRIAEQLLLPSYAASEDLDIVHCPDDMMPLPPRSSYRTVVTIHDVNFHSFADRIPRSVSRLCESWVRRSADRADAIITVSEFSRREIILGLAIPAARVSVIHNAPAIRTRPLQERWPALALRHSISRDYLIAFTDGSPHKNLVTLLRAFAVSAQRHAIQLVVIGREPRRDKRVRGFLSECKPNGSVIFTGYLSDDDLSLMMMNAKSLVFPSLYEGFGLPVVEAMAAGVPVACSKASALPEIAAPAAVFFSPSDPVDIALAIERIMTDESLRRRLIAAGKRRVRRFSWERAARQTIEVYERVVHQQGLNNEELPEVMRGRHRLGSG